MVLVVVGEVLVQDDGTKRTSLERWEERNGGEERERHEEVLPAWWVSGLSLAWGADTVTAGPRCEWTKVLV